MSRLTLEVGGEPRRSTCPDCGHIELSTTGFIYRDGDAWAIYHATLAAEGHEPRVDMGIGIGDWQGEGAVAETSVFLRAWADADKIQFGFVDPSSSPWGKARLFRGQLLAEQARIHPRCEELLRLAECVTRDDPTVARHLG